MQTFCYAATRSCALFQARLRFYIHMQNRTLKPAGALSNLARLTSASHSRENIIHRSKFMLKRRKAARSYPQDFRASHSPTTNPMVKLIQEGLKSGYFRKDDAWEIVFEMSALSHGLIMLYLGGRMGVPPTRFRALYRRSFRRYIRGFRD